MNPLVLAGRETLTMLRSIWRNRSGAFFTVLLPVMFLLLFGAINRGATVQLQPHGPQIGYTTFFTPGMLGMAIMTSTFVSLVIGLAIMRDNGQLKRLRGTSLPPWAFFAGQVLSRLVLVAVEAVVVARQRLPARPPAGRHAAGAHLRPRARRDLAGPAQPAGVAGRRAARRAADVPLGMSHLRGDGHDRGAARGHHPRWPGPRLPGGMAPSWPSTQTKYRRLAHHPRRPLLRGPGYWKRLGPGIVTGAADDDPSGIGTATPACCAGWRCRWSPTSPCSPSSTP